MDDSVASPAPRHVIESLDESVRDIASGTVEDAGLAEAEARRMLAEYERARLAASASRRSSASKSARAR